MLKKGILLVSSVVLLSSVFTGCQNRLSDIDMEATPTVQQEQNVNASSFSTIRSQIVKTMKEQFQAMDKDGNKELAPSEFGVGTPETLQAFNKIDSNNDGKITEKEFNPNVFESTKMALSYRATARKLFDVLDKNKDKYLSKEELSSPLISGDYLAKFQDYDKEKKWFFFFNKGTKDKLSKSEFENMFADMALKANAPAAAQQ
ncbi:MAG: EF-hand domain-containing protein [Candidatus Sericytochromatia bacterium]